MTLKKNQEVILNIENYGYSGEGTGKIEGFPVFINGALKNEKVKVKILKVNKSHSFGKVMDIITPSPHRIVPNCNFYENCGGCDLLHMDYNEQMNFKRERVENCIKRIGKSQNSKINSVIGMENPYYYRNKAQLPVKMENGKVKIGFYKERSNTIVNIDKCTIQNEETNNIIRIFKSWAETNFNDDNFNIKHLMTRVSYENRNIMVVIVSSSPLSNNIDELINKFKELKGMKSIINNINPLDTNVILGEKNITLWGDDYITDSIGNYKFNISPKTFFQVNPIQTKILYDKVMEYGNFNKDDIVIDGYSGAGTISLYISSKCKMVYGIEIVKEAIEDGNKNIELNNVSNVQFIHGKCEEEIPKLLNMNINPDTIILDPPRKGCEKSLLEAISHSNIKKIIYVSCDPATLGRDVFILSELGYSLKEVTPIDMFPGTKHVESVSLLIKQ